jgi:hypothetical protein
MMQPFLSVFFVKLRSSDYLVLLKFRLPEAETNEW